MKLKMGWKYFDTVFLTFDTSLGLKDERIHSQNLHSSDVIKTR